MLNEPKMLSGFDAWTDAFADHVAKKGKVKPNEYRALGYRPAAAPGSRHEDQVAGGAMALGLPVPVRHPRSSKSRDSTGTPAFSTRRERATSCGISDRLPRLADSRSYCRPPIMATGSPLVTGGVPMM